MTYANFLAAVLCVSTTATMAQSAAAPNPKKAQPTELTLRAQCEALGEKLRTPTKSVCEPLSSGNESIGASTQNRPLMTRAAGASERAPGAVRVLVLGAIHGDELSAGWLALQWAQYAPPSDNGTFSVLHAPIVNPDGLFERAPSRTNARGVDINRNFPTPNWNVESAKWWKQKAGRDARRWPGKTAASEPETKQVIALIKSYRPSVIVSIHAPLALLDYDGGGLPPERIGSIWLDSVGIYPGSLGHYASRVHGIPVLTVELPHALKVVSDQESQRMWRDLFTWVRKYASHDSLTK
jgi:murein peptide amidase A